MAKSKLILDRYRLLGEAGAGGYGTVMVAKDPRIQRKVAIKAIPLSEIEARRAALPGADAVSSANTHLGDTDDFSDGASNSYSEDNGFLGDASDCRPDAREHSLEGEADDEEDEASDSPDVQSLAHIPGLDEARTAAMLSDPHIVTVYDVEVRDQTAYLVMEYIEGITLSKLLRDYADSLTLDVVAAVFDSVAAALRKAHARRVLHLDIKPDNILINREGQVKVTDFGLATLVDASGVGTTGGGTIGYMPLEQMRREQLDMRADEWSLAAVTYEMLTGENPFIAPDLVRAEQAIENAELVLPSLCWDNLDSGIDDVLFYALDPDKEERYATVLDFQEETDKFLGDAAQGSIELKRVVEEALDAARAIDDESDAADRQQLRNDSPEKERREQGFEPRRQKQPRAPREPRIPMSERLTAGVQKTLSRIFGALTSGLLGFFALANLPFFAGWQYGLSAASYGLAQMTGGATAAISPLVLLVVCALVFAAVGAALPHVGALLGFAALSLAFIMGANPVLGIVLLVASAAWWYFVGRTGVAEPNVAMALPVVGAFGFNAFLPLAAGTCLRPRNAFLTLAFSALWALALGACGTGNMLGWDAFANWDFMGIDIQGRFISMLTLPATWCIIASWLVAVVVESACNLRGSKPLSIFGIVAAALLLVVGAFAAAWFDAGMGASLATPAPSLLVPIIVSAAVMLGITAWLK